ncbi:UNVERIFIED_CONTAM: Ribonuclease HI [Sesamum radiatum]|uniref:Ribonuclease HI n=1 Tax=Sesamum radiatum TaxID=300843 RepID=A0AAW2R203_SESRA
MMRSIKQKKRSFGAERNRIIEDELNKLLKAGYVSEVQYTDWLANVAVVPKALEKWRATYQRLVNKMFKDKIGTTMEVYVDDMLVKSREEDHLRDLKQAFEYLATPPLLANPKQGEVLFLYLAISVEAISSVLADFVVEFTRDQEQEKNEGWLLHVDKSSNANNGGVGIQLQGPNEVEIEVAARLSFAATNNEAEYEALILGLQLALEAGAKELTVCTDSQLVAMQVEGAYKTRERTMMQYFEKVKELMARFDKCMVQQIPRSENERADALSKFGAMAAGIKSRKVTIMI